MSNESQVLDQTEVEAALASKPDVLRTAEHGCFELYKSYWGTYLRSCFDPDANVEITEENLKYFELNSDIHKIPADLWTRWVNLCFHFVDKVKSCVEVSVRILRSSEDPSKYRILVPKQVVSGAAVRVDTFDSSIDIETGEEITQYPPEGWIPIGSSHSHNTMPAFFSGTDDKYELGDPGIHLVVGSIDVVNRQYVIAASVVGSGRRFEVSYKDLIDATPVDGVTFHSDALKYVDYSTPIRTYEPARMNDSVVAKYYSQGKSDSHRYSKWLQKYTGEPSDESPDYSDPFYYNGDYLGSDYYRNDGIRKTKTDIKLWELEDLTNDYLANAEDDFDKLFALLSHLEDTSNSVQTMIDKMLYEIK